jgi:rare lipoprotein A
MTAAHPTLPLPSMIRVTNLHNGKSVVVRVNDRGPFAKNRVVDVSERAATLLGFKDLGTTEVKIELLRNDTDEMLERLKIKN